MFYSQFLRMLELYGRTLYNQSMFLFIKFQPVEIPYQAEDVIRAFLSDHVNMSEGLARFIRQYRLELNQKGVGAWTRLGNEKNLYILTGLLFLWLEHLRHPLLGSDELTTVVLHSYDHLETLRRLPTETSNTLEYLFRCIATLEPTPLEMEIILRRLSASLTQRTVFSTKDMITHAGYHSIITEKGRQVKGLFEIYVSLL